MTIQHKNIAEADLHEPKGVSTATSKECYVADGAGSGDWQKIEPAQLAGVTTNGTSGDLIVVDGLGNFSLLPAPHGEVTFYDLASPSVITYPSSATKVAPTTVASGIASAITEATTARLTYTGNPSVALHISYRVSLDQTSGANRDVLVAIYKNGSLLGGRSVSTTQSGVKTSLAGLVNVQCVTNDYFEVYVTNLGASGDVNVYSLQLSAIYAGS
jgi:hypothetical protein